MVTYRQIAKKRKNNFSVKHTREFCYAKSRPAALSFGHKHSKGSAAAWHSDYRGVVEKLHRRRLSDSFQEGASDVIMAPF